MKRQMSCEQALNMLGPAKGKPQPRKLPAVHLFRDGDYTVVAVEVKRGEWIEIIRERSDSPFSHIWEGGRGDGSLQ